MVRAKNSTELKSIEASLVAASKAVDAKLKQETKSLDAIQEEKRSLEKKLDALLQSKEGQINTDQNELNANDKKIVAQMQRDQERQMNSNNYTIQPSNQHVNTNGINDINATNHTNKKSNNVDLSQPQVPSQSIHVGQTPKKKIEREVKDQHPPAELQYSKVDVGRVIQLFVFRYNNWENLKILDYEQSNTLHKCKHVDGSEKWLDLKKKPIRGLVV